MGVSQSGKQSERLPKLLDFWNSHQISFFEYGWEAVLPPRILTDYDYKVAGRDRRPAGAGQRQALWAEHGPGGLKWKGPHPPAAP